MAKLCINSTENSKQNILKGVQFHLVLEREFLNQHQCCLSGVKKEQVNYSLLDTELVLRDLQILILVSLISLFSLSPPTQSFSSSSCVMILVITPIQGARLRILTSGPCHSCWRQPCPAGHLGRASHNPGAVLTCCMTTGTDEQQDLSFHQQSNCCCAQGIAECSAGSTAAWPWTGKK